MGASGLSLTYLLSRLAPSALRSWGALQEAKQVQWEGAPTLSHGSAAIRLPIVQVGKLRPSKGKGSAAAAAVHQGAKPQVNHQGCHPLVGGSSWAWGKAWGLGGNVPILTSSLLLPFQQCSESPSPVILNYSQPPAPRLM